MLEEDASQATPTTHPWRIVTAACVQRMPLVTREKSEIELRVEDLKDKLRSERSKLSDFELEERKNQQLKREREKRALEEDLEGEQVGALHGVCIYMGGGVYREPKNILSLDCISKPLVSPLLLKFVILGF